MAVGEVSPGNRYQQAAAQPLPGPEVIALPSAAPAVVGGRFLCVTYRNRQHRGTVIESGASINDFSVSASCLVCSKSSNKMEAMQSRHDAFVDHPQIDVGQSFTGYTIHGGDRVSWLVGIGFLAHRTEALLQKNRNSEMR